MHILTRYFSVHEDLNNCHCEVYFISMLNMIFICVFILLEILLWLFYMLSSVYHMYMFTLFSDSSHTILIFLFFQVFSIFYLIQYIL